MRLRTFLILATGAAAAIAAWLLDAPQRISPAAAAPAVAPVNRDYLQRDELIAFEERRLRENPRDQITARMLAAQYLQRFREQGDPSDVLRAQATARRSIVLQPQGNIQAESTLASALLTYHDFRGALRHAQAAIAGAPFDDSARSQEASLLMELGQYDRAEAVLAHTRPAQESPLWDSVQARYDEETGKIAQARALIDRAARIVDASAYISAYDRSWYHLRAGQLAFEAGDEIRSAQEYTQALTLFPENSAALMWEARLFRAQGRWRETLTAAARSASIYPLPQALGYEADAQRALGRAADARRTDALIVAEQRLFNAQGVNDRLLANYFVQRQEHLSDALRAARADYARRGDEIYADDTMAWTLAALGRWNEASAFAARAMRYGTQDPSLQFHAAVIALHTGRTFEAERGLKSALAIDPRFDPFDAADARSLLRAMDKRGRAVRPPLPGISRARRSLDDRHPAQS